MRKSRFAEYFLPWLLPLALLLTWWVATKWSWVSTTTLPSPFLVGKAVLRLMASGELPRHLWESLKRAMIGLIIGGTLGFLLALANGLSVWSNRLFDSSLQMLRNIPHLAIIPLAILWFGIGESAKQFLIVTGVFFPIYLNTLHGIRSLDPKLLEMGRAYGLSRWEMFRKIILPGAMPSILVGLRFALGMMWLTLIVAETIASDSGIGYMTMNAREFLQTDVVIVGILLYALLGKLADLIALGMEKYFLRWNPAYRSPNNR
jgi:sulfonate transport system permease protein